MKNYPAGKEANPIDISAAYKREWRKLKFSSTAYNNKDLISVTKPRPDCPDPQIRVRKRKLFFLFFNQNTCCGYSKEPSRWDGSFEHPKQMLKLIGKKIITILCSNVWCINLYLWEFLKARSADNRLSPDFHFGEVCWQPVVTRLFGLLTTGCHQQNVWWQPVVTSKKSADNQLYISITMCTLFNNIRYLMIYSVINCYSIHMYVYRDVYTKKYTFVYMIKWY